LLPVKALSKLFRAKFRDALRKTHGFTDIPAEVWEQDRVVHCKPVGDGRTALKYLAPYIFRVALSNRRIVKVENDQVTFRYRASGTGETQFCTLPAEKFIHRFLQHVLPKSFVKVRYYGLFSPSHRHQLTTLRARLDARPADALAQTNAVDSKSPPDSSSTSPSRSVRCPACGHVMQLQATLPPLGRAPP
jgi:hypothetical protein